MKVMYFQSAKACSMSVHSSGSKGSSWPIEDQPEEDGEHSSSSSTDFGNVQSLEAVCYHHKDEKRTCEAEVGDRDSAESGEGACGHLKLSIVFSSFIVKLGLTTIEEIYRICGP